MRNILLYRISILIKKVEEQNNEPMRECIAEFVRLCMIYAQQGFDVHNTKTQSSFLHTDGKSKQNVPEATKSQETTYGSIIYNLGIINNYCNSAGIDPICKGVLKYEEIIEFAYVVDRMLRDTLNQST